MNQIRTSINLTSFLVSLNLIQLVFILYLLNWKPVENFPDKEVMESNIDYYYQSGAPFAVRPLNQYKIDMGHWSGNQSLAMNYLNNGGEDNLILNDVVKRLASENFITYAGLYARKKCFNTKDESIPKSHFKIKVKYDSDNVFNVDNFWLNGINYLDNHSCFNNDKTSLEMENFIPITFDSTLIFSTTILSPNVEPNAIKLSIKIYNDRDSLIVKYPVKIEEKKVLITDISQVKHIKDTIKIPIKVQKELLQDEPILAKIKANFQ